MAYVYRHIRLDKNQPFFKGSKCGRKVVNVETGQVYESIKEAALVENIPNGTIKSWLSKKNFTKFRYH
jgi:hypothetical protein